MCKSTQCIAGKCSNIIKWQPWWLPQSIHLLSTWPLRGLGQQNKQGTNESSRASTISVATHLFDLLSLNSPSTFAGDILLLENLCIGLLADEVGVVDNHDPRGLTAMEPLQLAPDCFNERRSILNLCGAVGIWPSRTVTLAPASYALRGPFLLTLCTPWKQLAMMEMFPTPGQVFPASLFALEHAVRIPAWLCSRPWPRLKSWLNMFSWDVDFCTLRIPRSWKNWFQCILSAPCCWWCWWQRRGNRTNTWLLYHFPI